MAHSDKTHLDMAHMGARGLQLLEFNVQLFQQPRTEKLFSLVSLISVLHIYLNSTNVYHSKNTNMTFQRRRRFVKTKANENVNANLYKKNISSHCLCCTLDEFR